VPRPWPTAWVRPCSGSGASGGRTWSRLGGSASGGSHTWRYRLPVREKPILTLDTPLRTLAADPGVRRAITEVLDRHLPGIPIDSEAPEAASVSLNDILGYIPSVSAEFRDELSGALAVTREGTE